jgi:hypothetical protein
MMFLITVAVWLLSMSSTVQSYQLSSMKMNFAEKKAQTPLKIAIAGAGLGGTTTTSSDMMYLHS